MGRKIHPFYRPSSGKNQTLIIHEGETDTFYDFSGESQVGQNEILSAGYAEGDGASSQGFLSKESFITGHTTYDG